MPSRKSTWSFLAFLFIHFTLSGQTIRLEKINVDQGLSQSSGRQLVQDSLGFLWIGTHDGLNRYDGKNFKVYRSNPGDSLSLYASFVYRLKLDDSAHLWVGLKGALSKYQTEADNFINYLLYDSLGYPISVFDISFVAENQFLLGTDRGVYSFNPHQGTYRLAHGFEKLKNKVVQQIEKHQEQFWVVASSQLWLKTNEDQLRNVDSSMGLPDVGIFSLLNEPGRIYVSTAKGAYFLDQQSKSFQLLAGSIEKTVGGISAMMRARNGDLWLGSSNIAIFSKSHQFIRTISNSPSTNPHLDAGFIFTLFQTKDNLIWIGKGLGLYKIIEDNAFSLIRYSPDQSVTLCDDAVFSVYTENDTLLYVASLTGLAVIDLVGRKTKRYFSDNGKDFQSMRILSFLRDSKNNLWLGSNGLILFDTDEKKMKFFLEGRQGDENMIVKIEEVASNTLVFSVRSKGLWFFDIPTKTVTKKINFVATSFLKDNDLIWAGTSEDGIKIIDLKGNLVREYRHHRKDRSGPNKGQVSTIFKDSKGRIWIGMYGDGFSLWQPQLNKFLHYNVNDGLPNPVVYSILEDDENNLWISTGRGIAKFNPENNRFVCFQEEDGLQSNEFNLRVAHRSRYGRLYFGGINGLTYFDPKRVTLSNAPTTSYFTELFINNELALPEAEGPLSKNILLTNQVDLSYKQNNLGLKITTLDFIHPHRLRYQFKLENYDSIWYDLGNRDFINITNLQPGTYQLKLRSTTGTGKWTTSGISLKIHINSPFWLTRWFRWFSIFDLFLIGLIYYKIRVRGLKRAKHRLEQIVKSRTTDIQRQKEEIAAQNEELHTQSDVLAHKNTELEVKSRMLEDLTRSLEDKINERTENLRLLNKNLLEQNTRLEQFSFITAHNIRGPVASLKGLFNILSRENMSQSEFLNRCDECIERIDSVIHDLTKILDIHGGAQHAFDRVNLLSEFQVVLNLLDSAIKEKNITIDLNQFSSEASIIGNRAYVESILYNLLSNAVKFSKNNAHSFVSVRCSNEKGKVKIIFEDNGIGIDMVYAENKIFHLYQRFNTSAAGKGFGLYLVKTQVEAMDGIITLDSQLGKGATFTIEFPQG